MSTAITEHIERAPFEHIVRGPYTISSRGVISDEQATRLVQLLQSGAQTPGHDVLGGRGHKMVCELPDHGQVFVKRYSHGGMLRALTGGRFLSIGPCRSQSEFEMLELVRSIGVHAPNPLAFIRKGSAVFSTWLVMDELVDARSLAALSADEQEELHQAMDQLAEQVAILVRHGILHVDLHPGNVVVSRSGQVSIVDFDKARSFWGSQRMLRDMYLRRWRRAVIKHHLSPLLSELMCLALRSNDD